MKNTRPILPAPAPRIVEHRVWQIDTEHLRGREIAGPFFDAGGLSAAIATLPDYQGDLHIPECHRLWLMLQGKMKVRFGRDTIIAEQGDLVCMPAGVLTSRSGLGPIEVIYIQLDDIPLWAQLKSIGQSIRKYESADMLYILVSSLTSALMSQDVYSIRCAREDSETLVTLLKRELRQDTNERSSSRMKRLTDLIDSIRKQPAGKWDSPTIARMVHMSQRNLNRTFHRVFNMPPAKMVTSIRMDIAARMLIESDMPLRAIASAVGYDSSFSFSRLFKKHAEISPAHYRELRRNQK